MMCCDDCTSQNSTTTTYITVSCSGRSETQLVLQSVVASDMGHHEHQLTNSADEIQTFGNCTVILL